MNISLLFLGLHFNIKIFFPDLEIPIIKTGGCEIIIYLKCKFPNPVRCIFVPRWPQQILGYPVSLVIRCLLMVLQWCHHSHHCSMTQGHLCPCWVQKAAYLMVKSLSSCVGVNGCVIMAMWGKRLTQATGRTDILVEDYFILKNVPITRQWYQMQHWPGLAEKQITNSVKPVRNRDILATAKWLACHRH